MRTAIARGRKARLWYTDAGGGTSERAIWPVLLGWLDGFEMVAAWCELRQAFRHFRIDRVQTVGILEEAPPQPRHLLLGEYRRREPGLQL